MWRRDTWRKGRRVVHATRRGRRKPEVAEWGTGGGGGHWYSSDINKITSTDESRKEMATPVSRL